MKEQIITKKTSLNDMKQIRRIEALRANLRKRKDQVRKRQQIPPETTSIMQHNENQESLHLSVSCD